MKIVNAIFGEEQRSVRSAGVNQYDYGDRLQIHGLKLPTAVEVHFSLSEKDGEAVTRIGVTKDGVTDVAIPDSFLENGDATADYSIYAWVYLSDSGSGHTEYKISIPVLARAKPEAFDMPEQAELFRAAIDAVNESASRAEAAGIEARSWAIGGTGSREGEDTDNARHYAKQAADVAAEVPGVVEAGKKDIDEYVRSKETALKGDTGNVYFAAFAVKDGRLKMYSDPSIDKVRFTRKGSRLRYRLQVK